MSICVKQLMLGWLSQKAVGQSPTSRIQVAVQGVIPHKLWNEISSSKMDGWKPFAEVKLTALHNILANEQQHTEQSEPSYDTHLLETIDSNTTPTSTNMCHRGGEIDQDALLKTELLKRKMVDKEIYNDELFYNDFYTGKTLYFT
ncbi:hypothetical protein Tco_1002321 [Tanacetum coccineum]|uniref:Uncharacterized protein n=1 Tax=Tanacetum coccineum TaxID=301880 RepID=A0ABQ5F7E6_9ASTR